MPKCQEALKREHITLKAIHYSAGHHVRVQDHQYRQRQGLHWDHDQDGREAVGASRLCRQAGDRARKQSKVLLRHSKIWSGRLYGRDACDAPTGGHHSGALCAGADPDRRARDLSSRLQFDTGRRRNSWSEIQADTGVEGEDRSGKPWQDKNCCPTGEAQRDQQGRLDTGDAGGGCRAGNKKTMRPWALLRWGEPVSKTERHSRLSGMSKDLKEEPITGSSRQRDGIAAYPSRQGGCA